MFIKLFPDCSLVWFCKQSIVPTSPSLAVILCHSHASNTQEMRFYCSLSGQTRVQGPALCQSPLSHIDHSYCINISQWRRMSPPHTYFDSISESNIYDKHARHWNEWVGSPGFVISKFSPTHGGPSGGSERFAEEVPETWHSGQVFRPHLWCRFLLRAHDNRPFLAPPDADLPSPESRMKTPGSPPEPPGAQSQDARNARDARTPGTCEPAILPHPEPVYHLPLCAACTQHAHDLIPSEVS